MRHDQMECINKMQMGYFKVLTRYITDKRFFVGAQFALIATSVMERAVAQVRQKKQKGKVITSSIHWRLACVAECLRQYPIQYLYHQDFRDVMKETLACQHEELLGVLATRQLSDVCSYVVAYRSDLTAQKNWLSHTFPFLVHLLQ